MYSCSMHKALGLVLQSCIKEKEHGDICNSSTQEVQARGSDVQGYPQLKEEFRDILDDRRACLDTNKQTNQNQNHFTTTKNKEIKE